jgi:hypothetical protein
MKKFIVLSIVGLFVTLLACVPVNAGSWKVAFEWDDYIDAADSTHFELHESAAAGGPYSDTTIIVDNISPSTLTEIEYTSTKPDGTATTTYFILKAVGTNGEKSDPSNEVSFVYDFAPIAVPGAFTATYDKDSDTITFTWTQGDLDRVDKWLLYSSETSGQDYVELASIDNTGGPPHSATETITVPAGEKSTFYFVLVSFTEFGVFSQNSVEATVTIDKTKPEPVLNFRLKVVTQ